MSFCKLQLKLSNSSVEFYQDQDLTLSISFKRTLRIPDDGHDYPLPPALGCFPLRRVRDYPGRVPQKWLEQGGIFLPLYQRDAMWLSFGGTHWKPCAVKVAAGKVNAVSGAKWDLQLRDSREDSPDYLVCPTQPWLDGFNTGDGTIRQFIAMPLGAGYTVERQITGKEEHGGLQFVVYPAKDGHFEKPDPTYDYAHTPKTQIQSLSQEMKEKVETELYRALKEAGLAESELKKAKQCEEGFVGGLLAVELDLPECVEVLYAKALAATIGVDFWELEKQNLDPELGRLIPEDLARRYGVIPVAFQDNCLKLAMANPLDVLATDDISLITGYKIVPVQATEEAILRQINQQYGVTDFIEVEETVKDISAQDFGSFHQEMGLGAGGKMTQNIYPDPHGLETWDTDNLAELNVHLVDIATWCKITGEPAPSTPVNAQAYTQAGYPWFEIYEESLGDLPASSVLATVATVSQIDAELGEVGMDNSSLEISGTQVVSYVHSKGPIGQG